MPLRPLCQARCSPDSKHVAVLAHARAALLQAQVPASLLQALKLSR